MRQVCMARFENSRRKGESTPPPRIFHVWDGGKGPEMGFKVPPPSREEVPDPHSHSLSSSFITLGHGLWVNHFGIFTIYAFSFGNKACVNGGRGGRFPSNVDPRNPVLGV